MDGQTDIYTELQWLRRRTIAVPAVTHKKLQRKSSAMVSFQVILVINRATNVLHNFPPISFTKLIKKMTIMPTMMNDFD